jgi:hypothetical protein
MSRRVKTKRSSGTIFARRSRSTCVTAKPPTHPPAGAGFAEFSSKRPLPVSLATGKLVEREGLEPSTPAL